MRRTTTALALAVLALVAPHSAAGTPAWVETYAAEPGTTTYVDSIASGTVVAVIGGVAVVSKDHGMTWVPLGPLSQPPNGGSSETRVAVSSPTRWFSENGDAVATSTDAGTTWRRLAMPRVIHPLSESWEFATDIGAVDGAPVAAVGWNGVRVRGGCPYAVDFTPMLVTRDGGARWRRTDLPVTGHVDNIEWFDSRRAAAVVVELEWTEPERDGNTCGSDGRWTSNSVWTTADGGSTWRLAMRTSEWYVAASWATPTSVVVLGETRGVGRAYVSADGGRTFRKPVDVYTTPGGLNGFPSMEYVAGRRGYVGAILAGVYRTDNGGSEWTHETSAADAGVYGVPELTAMNRDRAVFAGPYAVHTRYGEAPVATAAPAAVVPGVPLVTTTSSGRVSSTVTMPAYGPLSVTLRVRRGA